MDPTAPNNPQSQNQSSEAQNIEPGQFVVAEAPGTQQAAQPASAPNIGLNPTQDLPSMNNSAPPGQMPPPPPPSAPPPSPGGPVPIQPDPTPFNATATATPPPTQGSSKLKSLKLIFILFAVLALIAAIGAAAWFFVLPKLNAKNEAATTSTGEKIEEASPIPKRQLGGFGEIPQATSEATGGATTPEGL